MGSSRARLLRSREAPRFVESSATEEESSLATPETEELKPVLPKLLESVGEPGREKSKAAAAESGWARLLKGAGGSASTESSMDVKKPVRLTPRHGEAVSGRPNDCKSDDSSE